MKLTKTNEGKNHPERRAAALYVNINKTTEPTETKTTNSFTQKGKGKTLYKW